MWIKSVKIKNYKSFEDSGWLEFDRHMNVIVGANHSGKSALLSVVGYRYRGIPHKSSRFRREEAINPISSIGFRFSISGREVRDLILANDLNLHIPVPLAWAQHAGPKDVLNRFFALPEIIFCIRTLLLIAALVGCSLNTHRRIFSLQKDPLPNRPGSFTLRH